MPNYIVTACYYEEMEITASNEGEAVMRAKRSFSGHFIAPDEITVEEIEEEEDEE